MSYKHARAWVRYKLELVMACKGSRVRVLWDMLAWAAHACTLHLVDIYEPDRSLANTRTPPLQKTS